jgi:hypothetical protein
VGKVAQLFFAIEIPSCRSKPAFILALANPAAAEMTING